MTKHPHKSTHYPSAVALAVAACFATHSYANPTAPKVISGVANFQQAGNTLNITNTPNAIINWGSFSIGANEVTRFIQQSQASAVLNRVVGQDPSSILGSLQSNGRVFLINPNGILFGAGSQINVGGLVASTLGLSNEDFLAGRMRFGPAFNPGEALTNAKVLNEGNITTSPGGNVYLIGSAVANNGIITSPKGDVMLAAGNSVELVEPGTPNQTVKITAPDNEARNLGQIIAESGKVGIYAGVINQSGTISADSALAEGGRILLKATKSVTLNTGSTSTANGTSGGRIEAQSETGLANIGGTLEARGSAGAGGGIAVSGDVIMQTGEVRADGTTGGAVSTQSRNLLNAGRISADGTQGAGGAINLQATHNLIQTEAAKLSAEGTAGDGGSVTIQAGNRVFSSTTASATGTGPNARGGTIQVLGNEIVLLGAKLDASGDAGGGTLLVGGDFQGKNVTIPNAQTTALNFSTTLKADARTSGDGGKVVVWSDARTDYFGNASARGGAQSGNGGLIEISGKENLVFGGLADAGAANGRPGMLLLDPKNIIIDAAASSSAYSTINLADPNPGAGDGFAQTVVVLSGGNIVASDRNDDFAASNAGAVYLYNGTTGALISSLTGASANDQVSSGGITALSNGNYVVSSPDWNNGAATQAGAVTWGSGTSGVAGAVSAANSLVGTTTSDLVGSGGITALSNGNFIVNSPSFDNGAVDTGKLVIYVPGGATGFTNPLLFGDNAASNATITPAQITAITNTGTAVTLQANNDITLAAASNIITNNVSGNGGAITLQAGRTVTLNSGITTDNGNLSITANDPGAILANRDAGAGGINVNSNATLNAGSGNVTLNAGTGGNLNITDSLVTGQAVSLTGNNINISGVSPGAGTLVSSGGLMTVNATNQLTLTANSMSAELFSSGGQTITAGGITLTGGGGTNTVAQIRQNGAGTNQDITITGGGTVTMQGGSAGGGNFAQIRNDGVAQSLGFGAGGALTLQGGTGTSDDYAKLLATTGTQTITGSPALTMTGATAGGATGQGNQTLIEATLGTQTLTLGTTQLNGPGGGIQNNVQIQAPTQNITVNGNLTLTGASGGNAGGSGTRIGSLANTPTNLNLTVHGNLLLQGGTSSVGSVGLGTNGASASPQAANVTVNADGNVTLNPGASSSVRIGHPSTLVGGGDVSVTAGGNITFNHSGSLTTFIRTLGDVSLDAGSLGDIGLLGAVVQGQNIDLSAKNINVGSALATAATSVASAGLTTVNAAGTLTLTGANVGTNISANLNSNGGQTITAGGITLTGGAGGTNNGAGIFQNGAGLLQDVTISGGGTLSLTGGAGTATDTTAQVYSVGPQTISFPAGGSLNLQAGSGSGGNNHAYIRAEGAAGVGAQTISFAGAGAKAINITGGTVGIDNSASISTLNNDQTISGNPDITLIGGASGGSAIDTFENAAEIGIDGLGGRTQNVFANNITLQGGSGGTGNSAQFYLDLASTRNITATGNVSINGGSGVSSAAGIGGGGLTTINVTGTLGLTGGANTNAIAFIAADTVNVNGQSGITLSKGGGTDADAVITTLVGGGSVTLKAGLGGAGSLVLNDGFVGHPGNVLSLYIGGSFVPGDVTLQATASGGQITQGAAGIVQAVTLTTSSSAGTSLTGANLVNSFNASNSASGNLQFTNTAAPLTITGISESVGGNVTVTNTGAVAISGPVNAPGNLTINGSGITQPSGALTVGGTSTFNAAAGPITLNTATNALTGAVRLNNTGANNVSLTNNTGTVLGASTVGSGTLVLTSSGPITQTGALTQAAGAGTATFNAGANAITLTNASNDFTGAVALNNTGANNVAVTDANALALAGGTFGGNLAVIANGAVTQNAGLTVAGTTSVNAGAGPITLNIATNALTGAVSLNDTGANSVSLTNNAATVLGTSSVAGGALSVFATGPITQTGTLTAATLNVGGTGGTTLTGANQIATFTATNSGSGNISLTNTGAPLIIPGINNAGGGNITVTNSGGSITTSGAISGVTTAGAGQISLTAAGLTSDITLNGQTTSAGGAITMSADRNLTINSGGSITTPANVVLQAGLIGGGISIQDATVNAGALNIFAATGMSLTANTAPAVLTSTGTQSITVGAGGLSLTGAGGTATFKTAQITQTGAVGTQTITVNGGGNITLNGGAGSGGSNVAEIRASGTAQNITFSSGGNLTLTGGASGSNNYAFLLSSAGGQTISGAPNISLTGGAGGGVSGQGNGAYIQSSGGAQNIAAGSITLQGGAGGTDNQAYIDATAALQTVTAGNGVSLTGGNGSNGFVAIRAPQQNLSITGNLLLQGASVLSSGSQTARIGALPGVATNLTMSVSGNATLTGGVGNAVIGSSTAGNTLTDIGLTVGGNLTLNAGSSGEAHIGSPSAGVAGGDISIVAGGNIALNANGATASAIRTLGNVTLQATSAGKSISEDAGSLIQANTLTATVNSGVTLNGNNLVTSLNATNTAANGIQFTEAAGNLLTVTGMSQTGGNVVITADDLNISGAINAGANSVTLRPTTLTQNINLESAPSGGMSLSPGDLANITAGVLDIGRSDNTGTGTMTVTAFPNNAQANAASYRLFANNINFAASVGGTGTEFTRNLDMRASNNLSIADNTILLANGANLALVADNDSSGAGDLAISNSFGIGNDRTILAGTSAANTASMLVQGRNISVTDPAGATMSVILRGSGTQTVSTPGTLLIQGGSIQADEGTQSVSAQAISVLGGATFGRLSGGTQNINVGAGGILVQGGAGTGNNASISQLLNSGTQTITVNSGGSINLIGGTVGSNNNAAINANGLAQTISANTAGGGIHLTGGASGSFNFATFNSNNASANQSITANSGGMTLQGGSGAGNDNWAHIANNFGGTAATGAIQSITVNGGGSLAINGGDSALHSDAVIIGSVVTQAVTLNGGGDLTLTGGLSGTNNGAIIQNLGAKADNAAVAQNITTHNLTLQGGGTSAGAIILGEKQTINAANTVDLLAGTGGAVRIGGLSSVTGNQTLNADVTLTAVGDITLSGNLSNFALIGTTTSGNPRNDLSITSTTGNVVLNGGTITGGARLGGNSANVGAGAISVTAGGNIALNDSGTAGGHIRTTQSVSLQAGGSVTEGGSNADIVGDGATSPSLSVTAGTGVSLSSANNQIGGIAITSSSGAISLANTAALLTLGNVTTNQAVTLTNSGNINLTGTLSAGSGDVAIVSTSGNLSLGGNISTGGALGMNAAGTITQTGGAISAPGTTSVNATGVSLTSASNDFGTLSATSSGNVTITDATAITIAASSVGGLFTVNASPVTFQGGLTANNYSFGGGTYTLSSGTYNLNGTTTIAASATVVAAGATINATGGAGTVNVSGVLDSNTGLLNAGTVNLLSGGMLKGNGTINANVNNTGGTVAPGASPGILTITGNYVQGPTGVLALEIGGTTPGTQYDQLIVTGNAVLGGTLNTTLVNGFVPVVGATFNTIQVGGTLSGTFATTNLPTGQVLATNYLASALDLVGLASLFSTPTSVIVPLLAPQVVATTAAGGILQPDPSQLASQDAIAAEEAAAADSSTTTVATVSAPPTKPQMCY